MSNTPDEILNDLINVASGMIKVKQIGYNAKDSAKEAFYQLILTEVIGEDEFEVGMVGDDRTATKHADYLRQEQRQTLAKLFGITEGEK